MSSTTLAERSRGARRRNHKACKRCRDQKIKCSGARPCEPCKRRGLPCNFDDQTEKVLVTRRYIDGLHDKLASLERKVRQSEPPTTTNRRFSSPQHVDEAGPLEGRRAFSQPTEGPLDLSLRDGPSNAAKTGSEAPLINPLAFHATDWVPGPTGLPVFMGTSSNWAFGRRVLTMTYERLMETPMPTADLLFDGNVYDLKWNGERDPIPQEPTLPSQDFALHLINAFKFHCGQLFHLMEEQHFMKHFYRFHEMPSGRFRVSAIWYVHYLLILAFGQAFVNQSTKVHRPPGRDLFLHAMRLMPDFSFFKADPVEKMQVLACVALYLQCIGYRPAAYQNIGRALSIALEHGMHTEIQSHYMGETYVQRCRRAWWTVYILERRMGSLLGVPMAIAEESISTPIPTIPGPPQNSVALQLQVRFAQTLAMIDQTVYGIEGQLDTRYLSATQSVLRRIANITEQLNESFSIHPNDRTSGISRISAHLHLQQHHCVILTTRPLLYIFLESKLGHSEAVVMRWLQSETVHCLLQICVESAQQTIAILSHLLDQGLLETFLPFDLDATFTATIALFMATVVDPTLLHEHSPWSQRAYTILDEMDTRGNSMAGMTQSELKTLDDLLDRLSPGWESSTLRPSSEQDCSQAIDTCATGDIDDTQSLDMGFSTEFGLYHGLDAEQLTHLADSLDLDSLA